MEQKQNSGCSIPDSPHMRAVGLFIRVMRRHHACVERRIGDLGIHHSQHRTLMQLARRQEDIPSQKELAEIMGISPAAVTTTLKKLEREGYIARSMTDEDNRKNEIRITAQGIAKVMESRAVFEATDKEMFAGFTSEEIATLISYMERLDRNLDAAGAPADPSALQKTTPERKCDRE
ncbi:MAG: MarR family transcriptional regulator [Clostridia bacterium]|nr:MarR family transcriptional regulator [Clostridia bacterium]